MYFSISAWCLSFKNPSTHSFPLYHNFLFNALFVLIFSVLNAVKQAEWSLVLICVALSKFWRLFKVSQWIFFQLQLDSTKGFTPCPSPENFLVALLEKWRVVEFHTDLETSAVIEECENVNMNKYTVGF
jgi:hypothetical protein